MKPYSLSHLADHVLLRDLATLVSQDRVTAAAMLAHLAEVDARKLYLPAAYPSMYMYCLKELHFSEDAAFKRIQVARTARQFPAIFTAVADGRLHLSAVVLLAPHLTPETADTPAKLVYLAVQLMYISPDPVTQHGTYFNLVRDIVTAVPSAAIPAVSFSLARFTLASFTPGSLRTFRSIVAAQLAQVMPVTGMMTLLTSDIGYSKRKLYTIQNRIESIPTRGHSIIRSLYLHMRPVSGGRGQDSQPYLIFLQISSRLGDAQTSGETGSGPPGAWF